jgi:transcription initiation factor TFIIE subunit alpha
VIILLIIIDEPTAIKTIELAAGKGAVEIVKLLMRKPWLTDEEIANILKIDIKETRKILHRLHELSLISYDVARDVKLGRRIFKWNVQTSQMIGFIKVALQKTLERLRLKLEYEQSHQFYYCGTPGCRKYTFEESVNKLFKCPTCGKILELYDNSKIIEAIKEKISQIEKELIEEPG